MKITKKKAKPVKKKAPMRFVVTDVTEERGLALREEFARGFAAGAEEAREKCSATDGGRPSCVLQYMGGYMDGLRYFAKGFLEPGQQLGDMVAHGLGELTALQSRLQAFQRILSEELDEAGNARRLPLSFRRQVVKEKNPSS